MSVTGAFNMFEESNRAFGDLPECVNLNDQLLLQLECPVCLDPVVRPIRTCTLGHPVSDVFDIFIIFMY